MAQSWPSLQPKYTTRQRRWCAQTHQSSHTGLWRKGQQSIPTCTVHVHSTGIVLLYVKYSIHAKLHRVMNTLTRLGALYSMNVCVYTANQIGTVQTRAGTMLILPIEAPLEISSNALKLCSSTTHMQRAMYICIYNGNFVIVHDKRHTVSSD